MTHGIVIFKSDEWEGYFQHIELMHDGFPDTILEALVPACKKYLKEDFTDWDPVIVTELVMAMYFKTWPQGIGLGSQDTYDDDSEGWVCKVNTCYQPNDDTIWNECGLRRIMLLEIPKSYVEDYDDVESKHQDFEVHQFTLVTDLESSDRPVFEAKIKALLGNDVNFVYL